MLKKTKWKESLGSMMMPLCAILFALLISSILIVIMGLDLKTAYSALLKGAFGGKAPIAETFTKMIPLMFTALSYALAKRCGMINLGAEGQLYMGGLCAAIVALNVSLPAVLHIPLCMVAAIIGGGLWGMLAGALKLKFGASEMITTIMLNYIAQYFVNFCVDSVIREPGGVLPQSAKMPVTAQLPRFIQGTRLHLGIVFAFIFVIIYYIFLWRTRQGFETRVVGLNAEAARYAGFNGKKRSLTAMFMAGGVAGMAGLTEVLGIQLRVYKNFSPSYGFDGIATALLGNNTPLGIVLSSGLFGALRSGSNQMQIDAGVPAAMVNVIQALVILFVIGSAYFSKFSKKRAIKRAAKEDKA